jgi:Sensors of blue-light using FAD
MQGRVIMITRLTYFSRNAFDRINRAREDCVRDILIESVTNNRRDDVTGALIHDHCWLAQVLEGPEDRVSATFERILRDARHTDVRLVKLQVVPARRFGPSWLTIVGRRDDNTELFRHYAESDRFDPESMTPDRLGDLIEALVGSAPSLQETSGWTTRSATNTA